MWPFTRRKPVAAAIPVATPLKAKVEPCKPRYIFDADGHRRPHPDRQAEMSAECWRRWNLLYEHYALESGKDCPRYISRGLMGNPNSRSKTSDWHRYRKIYIRKAGEYPDEAYWPFQIERCDAVLAFRASLPIEDHFWQDESYAGLSPKDPIRKTNHTPICR
jgi:hypothetical protein